jgi:benzoate-CoA ligase
VLLLMHDCSDWVVAFLGALHAGVVPVAVNTLLPRTGLRLHAGQQPCAGGLVSGALLPTLQAALVSQPHEVKQVVVSRATEPLPPGAHDLAALTAAQCACPSRRHPRGRTRLLAVLQRLHRRTQRHGAHPGQPVLDSRAVRQGVLGLRESDRVFSAAKLFFAYGLGNALSFPLSVGASVVLMAERPTPQACFKRLVEHQPTVFYGAPTGYGGMLAAPTCPHATRWRCACAPRLAKRCRATSASAGPTISGWKSSTASAPPKCCTSSSPTGRATCAMAPPASRCRATGRAARRGRQITVPDNEIGDLYIQGPSAALMYWNNRAKSRDTFQGGWTKAGDKYSRDADGYCTYAGRNDDMLKVSGIYVSPFEVEATLVQHPAVLEAAVIGKEDTDGLTKTKAFVVLKSGAQATEAELKAFVKDRLAPFKYPRSIEFLSELPKTATGKIQRFRLREIEKNATQDAGKP